MMVFEKKQEAQPEIILLGGSPQVDDIKATEILFIDPAVKERPVQFLRGMMTGAAIVIALWLGLNFWTSGQEETGLVVLKRAVESCGELTRLRSYFESVVDYRQAEQSGRPRNFAVMVNGSIESGFDMRRARVEVFMRERRVEVTLPHGRIERMLMNLVKDSRGGVRAYDQQGELSTRTFSAKEQSGIMSSAMREVRRRASGEWEIASKAEENAKKIYGVVLGALSCDVNVNFTNEAGKLGMPEGVSGEVMKDGGAFIVRSAGR